MAGDPGLIFKINSEREKTGGGSDPGTVKLTKSKIGNTLNFMTDLAAALPDSKIAESLGGKLNRITSYNVCYTKLLRVSLSRYPKMLSGISGFPGSGSGMNSSSSTGGCFGSSFGAGSGCGGSCLIIKG